MVRRLVGCHRPSIIDHLIRMAGLPPIFFGVADTHAIDDGTGHSTRIVDPFTVAFYGLTKNADAAARSMLRLLLPMLGNRWRGAESDRSDVVILEARTLAEMREAASTRDDTLYIVFSEDESPPPGAFATVQRPLNSARLVELLHAAQAELEKRSGVLGNTTVTTCDGDGASTSSSVASEEEKRSVRTSMRTAIRWALKDKARAVAVRDLKQAKILTLLPGVGFTSRLRSNDLANLIRADKQVDLVDLNETEKAALRTRRTFAPLRKLEWIYWLAGSNGEIRPELKVSRRYQLRKYPDFAVLPHYRADVVMASLLKSEPMSVGDLAQRAGVRLETACNFVNACWAIGYLTHVSEHAAPSRRKAEKTEEKNEVAEEVAGGLMAPLRKLGLLVRG